MMKKKSIKKKKQLYRNGNIEIILYIYPQLILDKMVLF